MRKPTKRRYRCGHPKTKVNTNSRNQCRLCVNEYQRRLMAARRLQGAA